MSSIQQTQWGRPEEVAPTALLRVATRLFTRPGLRLRLLLAAPMFWLGVLYLGSLLMLFVTSIWTIDSFTGRIQRTFTLGNFVDLVSDPVYRIVAGRTLAVAALVTVLDALIALPVAYFAAKVLRTTAARSLFVVAVSMPLWANYLVKGYAWRIMLDSNGVLDWLLRPLGGHGPGLGLSATVLALMYLWLPYMILPVYAGFDRLPNSLLEAAADLGAKPWRTFRTVVFPMVLPAVIAGSVFTFSLTLGDYIMVKIVGRATQLYANIVYDNIGVAGDLPFAAAAAVFPVVVVLGYLVAVRRTGALANL